MDPSQAKYTFADYSQQAGVKFGPTPNISAAKSYKLSAGIIAQLLKLPLKVDASANDVYTVTQSFSGGQEANIDESGENAARQLFYQHQNLSPKNTYYFVRGAITATAVKYDFDRDISASFGADLPVKVVTVSPNASYSATNGFHYDDKFPIPVNVCIEPHLLPYPPLPAGAAVAAATPQPLGNTVLFTSVQLP